MRIRIQQIECLLGAIQNTVHLHTKRTENPWELRQYGGIFPSSEMFASGQTTEKY